MESSKRTPRSDFERAMGASVNTSISILWIWDVIGSLVFASCSINYLLDARLGAEYTFNPRP